MPGWSSWLAERTGVLLVAEVRYAVRVRGHSSHATAVASQEGLELAVNPVCTVLRGQLPDQSALFGVLRWVRQLGLELVEVRRLPQHGNG